MEQSSVTVADLGRRVLERLAEALREQGVAVEVGEKSCQVEGDALSVGCRILEQRPSTSGDIVLGVVFQVVPGSDPDFVIQDQVAGVAPTPEGAVEKAVVIWMEGSWPVLRAVFLEEEGDALNRFLIESMNFEANQMVTWQVIPGPLQTVGSAAEGLVSQLESAPPLALLMDELAPLLEAQGPRPYWLKLFLGRQVDGTVSGEVRVNNVSWEAGLYALQGFDWPPLSDYAGFHQVVLLQPTTPPS